MVQPIYSFASPEAFASVHIAGTKIEHEYEKRQIGEFNKKAFIFQAWCIMSLGRSTRRGQQHWLFLVAPGDKIEWRMPREGETCKIKLLSNSGKTAKSSWWNAERIDNPGSALGLPPAEWQRYAAFKVSVNLNSDEAQLVKPLIDADSDVPSAVDLPVLFGKKGVKINFQLDVSEKTMMAELGSIERLLNWGNEPTVTKKQYDAFNYLMQFKSSYSVDLFDKIPHLARPVNNAYNIPKQVVVQYEGFNEHQKAAYRRLLADIPSGICIIPGGPGAGKTHWNLVLTCMAQARDIEDVNIFGVKIRRGVKVLYLLDINKPLDDTANKIVKRYKELGLKKNAVRLYSWNYFEKKGVLDFTRKFLTVARVRRSRKCTNVMGCLAPTLDELAYSYYLRYRDTKYSELSCALPAVLKQGSSKKTDLFHNCVSQLYKDVLDDVDLIATTPVPAAERFSDLWKPDLVFFDESPHARELSTLIAIANYEPFAWILSGDHRQTRPFVATDDVRDNKYSPQMLVSTMERADKCGAIKYSLLINHRAYGGLEQLASQMFYRNAMTSGIPEAEVTPSSVTHLRNWMGQQFMRGRKCQASRLLVHFDDGEETLVGKSWYNSHTLRWVMEQVQCLCQDPKFVQVGKRNERGTILIIAPYKEQFLRYKTAIKNLPKNWQVRLKAEERLEARTIDTVQGHEADFVFLDFVRCRATSFTDDPNRLCVAITRARQAEIIILQPGMKITSDGRYSVYLNQIWNDCEKQGQIALISSRVAPDPLASLLGNVPSSVPPATQDLGSSSQSLDAALHQGITVSHLNSDNRVSSTATATAAVSPTVAPTSLPTVPLTSKLTATPTLPATTPGSRPTDLPTKQPPLGPGRILREQATNQAPTSLLDSPVEVESSSQRQVIPIKPLSPTRAVSNLPVGQDWW